MPGDNIQSVNGAGIGAIVTSVDGQVGAVDTSGGGAVSSVDGQTGVVVLSSTYLALAGGTLVGALTGTTMTGTVLTGTTAVRAGATPWASSGQVRLPSLGQINWRNAADSGDIGGFSSNASDQVQIGSDLVGSSDSFRNLGSSTIRWANVLSIIGTFGGNNPASAGALRMPNATSIVWRNAANSGNVTALTVNSSDQLSIGADLVPSSDSFRNLGAAALRWANILGIIVTAGGNNPAASGQIRLPNGSQINFRNNANSGDIVALAVDSSDRAIVGADFAPASDNTRALGTGALRWASITAAGEIIGKDLAPASTTGATVAARYFRGTASGAPTTGTWVAGDIVPGVDGAFWHCTVGGTPGTWVQTGSGTYQTIAIAATKAATNEVVDAKGDLLVGSAADTLARLAVGTNGKVPVANSNSSTGLIYANVTPSLARVGGYTRAGGTSANNTQTANRLYFSPILLSRRITWDRIAVNHAATTAGAGSVIRLGVYNNATTGYDFPDALAFDAGTVAADTAAAFKTITISQALDPGLYWLAVVVQWVTTAPSMAAYVVQAMESPVSDPATITANSGFYYQDTVTGTLPGTATPSANMSLNCPVVWLRAS